MWINAVRRLTRFFKLMTAFLRSLQGATRALLLLLVTVTMVYDVIIDWLGIIPNQ